MTPRAYADGDPFMNPPVSMSRFAGLALLTAALLAAGCGEPDPDAAPAAVRSHLAGRITVSPEVDSTQDYRGFEVLVAVENEAGELDTLGLAVTDSTGAFATDITAPDRGIYPLLVSRRGGALKMGELVVAEGDSAQLTLQLPDAANRPLRIRSLENAAWLSYRNARAQFNQTLYQQLQGGAYDEAQVERGVRQTTAILWSLGETFPGTIGAELAAAESIAMLDGWDDSLLVARARTIDPSNVRYVDVAQAARRAQARLEGLDSAVALLRDFQSAAEDEDERAALQAEIVVAYIDSLQQQPAIEAARALQQDFAGDTTWTGWAERALYELENLMPGMAAPSFTVTDADGELVTLEGLRGTYVVLEFFAPRNEVFLRELPLRNQLVAAAEDLPVSFVSLSVEPDTLVNATFIEERQPPGTIAVLPGGPDSELLRRFNVNVLPTRFLIDPEGNLVGKYPGSALGALQRDLSAALVEDQPS